MGRKLELVGHKFGRLSVLNRAGQDKRGNSLWECLCDCGKKTIKRGCSLVRGETKTCGCFRESYRWAKVPAGQTAFLRLYGSYKKHAKDKGFIFEINKELFRELTKENCFYCGISPMTESFHKGYNGSYIYNGLDRVDNEKGYTKGNVVPCCHRCNIMKYTMSQNNFRKQVLLIAKNWGGK